MTALGLLSAGLGVAFVGCSSDDTSGGGGGTDAGKDTSTDAPATGPKQSGTLLDFPVGTKVKDATITLGSGSGTSGADGKYSIATTKDTPFFMRVTHSQYLTLIEQEWQLSGDADRGPTQYISQGVKPTLLALLESSDTPKVKQDKGILAVGIVLEGACTEDGGVVIKIDTGAATDAGTDAGDGGGDAGGSDAGSGDTDNIVRYFTSVTSVAPMNQPQQTTKNQNTPAVAIYNVTPGENVQLSVTPSAASGCTVVKQYPHADPKASNIKYTGKIKVEAGTNTFSFARVFLTK
ncbi:hypothetical protein LZC95_31160 [Pendulispora brunnea]|uniref:Lipoprotein n=1 Tax=Pendulispora brunnea TaxID=2905690 RepID=A0ABZ2JWP7_9BACT